jgi:hypothetical protein
MGAWSPSAQMVAINEVMASNGSVLADRDGDYEDWLELHNYGDGPLNLAGYGLSDNAAEPFKWTFPEVAIGSGEYLLVWASGKNRREPGSELHANFAIRAAGQEVILTRPDGALQDEFPAAAIPRNLTMGRVPDGTGEWFYFDEPTPGAKNTTMAYTGVLSPPEISLPAGFYPEEQEVIALHAREDVVLRYTLDGSAPTSGSPLFPGSLRVASRVGEPNQFSSIKTTAGGDFWRNPNHDVFKATVLRVRAFPTRGELPSVTVTRTYFVGEDVEGRYSLPVLSVVTDRDHFFGHERGIYVAGAGYDGEWRNSNYWQRGRDWERPAHLEIFEQDGKLGLAQDVGTRIHGGWSRRWAFKSLRFYARSDYGQNEFSYRLFPDQPYDSYKRFIIRNSGNDHEFTLLRDAFMQRLVGHMQFDTQAYRPAIIFINGEYWGIKNLRERYDRHYLARVHGVDPDNLDLLHGNRWVKEGNAAHYNAMLQYIRRNGVSDPEHYEHVQRLMDVDNFIDYNIAQIYLNNTDWPGNNIDFWRLRTEEYVEGAPYGHDGRWRWMLFDTDFGFWQYDGSRDRPTHNALAFATAPGGTSWPNPDWSTFLLRSLLENESFRLAFINRFADQLNTAFLPARVIPIINEMASVIEPEIAGHVRRFGRPSSVTRWNNDITRMRDFGNQRGNHQFGHIRAHFQLSGLYTLTVDVGAGGEGKVRVNSIAIDENTLGLQGEAYPWSGRYFRGVPLEIEAIPEPGYRFVRWLELEEETERKTTIAPEGNVSLTAVFEPVPPALAQIQVLDGGLAGQSGEPLPRVQVTMLAADLNEGEIRLSLAEGDGFLAGTLTGRLEDGQVSFEDLIIHGAGLFRLQAVVDGNVLAVSDPVRVAKLSAVVLPQFLQGEQPDNFNRVPFPFRLRIEGLLPNAVYRYGNRVVVEGEDRRQDGAGNMLFVVEGGNFLRNTNAPRFRASDHGLRHYTFTTDDRGNYTGWFVSEPTGNWRMVPGTDLRMRLLLNDGEGGEDLRHSLTTRETIRVVEFGSGTAQASAIFGEVSGNAGDFTFLFDNEEGAGRPLAGGLVEQASAELDERYAGFYLEWVSGWTGRFGTLLPNRLPAGMRRLEVKRLEDGRLGAVYLFPDGHPRTVNPENGMEPLLFEPGEPVFNQELTFREWMQLKGLSSGQLDDLEFGGIGADPDLDGIPNVLEYALEGDPLVPGRAVLPYLDQQGSSVAIVFPRSPFKHDLAWVVKASSDLEDWSEVLYDSRQDDRENNYGSWIRVEDYLPAYSSDGGRFFRLIVLHE